MATTIKTKHSNTTGTTPTGLVTGELAVNTADKKIWIGDGSATPVVLIGNKLSEIETASATDGGFLVGDGTKFVVETATTAKASLDLGALADEDTVNLGTQVTGTLPVGKGGTGATSLNSGKILKGAGTSAIEASGISIDSNDVLTFGTNGFVIPKASGSNPTSATAGQFFSDISTARLTYNRSAGNTETLAYTSEIPAAANNGTLTLATSGTGISLGANKTFSANQASNATITITSDATNNNTASTIVARDGSGNFAAGTITAALNGNASTATEWATARTITLAGDLTGNVSIDGSENVTLTATVAANSVTLGTDTSGNYVGSISGTENEIQISEIGDAGGEGGSYTIGLPDSVQITSNLTVGGNLIVNGTTTTVNSTTVTLDDPIITLGGDTNPTTDDAKDRGVEFRYYDNGAKRGFMGYDNSADNFVLLTDATNASEVFTGTKGTLVADLTGVASSATALATSRNFSITGDITAPAVGFNGTQAVALNASIAAGVVGTTELADDAVTNAKIANNAVTLGTQTTGNYVASVTGGTAISVSGTGESAAVTVNLDHLGIEDLTGPGADRILFWDQTAGFTDWLQVGSNLTIIDKTITATNTTYTADNNTLTLSGTIFSINSTYSGQTSITTLGTVETGTINGGTF